MPAGTCARHAMPRRVLDGAVDARACAELIALSRACGRQGFRAATRAATLSDVARDVPAGAAPLVEAREAVREAAEEWLGCFPGELHVQVRRPSRRRQRQANATSNFAAASDTAPLARVLAAPSSRR